MIRITERERDELRLALKSRSRMNGSGTAPHQVCEDILRKLDEADMRNQENGIQEHKVAGVDSRKFPEH